MRYLTNLQWQKNFGNYNNLQQKVLLALSTEEYKWRTKQKLVTATGLKEEELDEVLADLMSNDVIRPSFSKNRNIIFGLRERVG